MACLSDANLRAVFSVLGTRAGWHGEHVLGGDDGKLVVKADYGGVGRGETPVSRPMPLRVAGTSAASARRPRTGLGQRPHPSHSGAQLVGLRHRTGQRTHATSRRGRAHESSHHGIRFGAGALIRADSGRLP